ncbi:hypothetical protein CF326_g9338, partial [Tilletia indica]
ETPKAHTCTHNAQPQHRTLHVSRTGQIPYPHERISCLLNSASAPASTFQILNAQPRFTATSFLLPSTATTPASLKETWIFRTSTQISSCSSLFINYPPFAFDVSKFTLRRNALPRPARLRDATQLGPFMTCVANCSGATLLSRHWTRSLRPQTQHIHRSHDAHLTRML